MEDTRAPGDWPEHFRAFVMSAPVDADLLAASSWSCSNRLAFAREWLDEPNAGWLEGNIVVAPDGEIVNILRINSSRRELAAMVRVSEDGSRLSFDPKNDFIYLPGGNAKFTIRYDPESAKYWALVNRRRTPATYRNVLALVSSSDLRHWTWQRDLLQHHDPKRHSLQYVDWQIEGRDLIAVSRTAWDEAHRAHDADYMTFHRFPAYRD